MRKESKSIRSRNLFNPKISTEEKKRKETWRQQVKQFTSNTERIKLGKEKARNAVCSTNRPLSRKRTSSLRKTIAIPFRITEKPQNKDGEERVGKNQRRGEWKGGRRKKESDSSNSSILGIAP